jgi:Uma2 family endonuclease
MATKIIITEEEYLRTSFDNPDREFRDGELVERSLPIFKHGTTQGELYVCFRSLRPKFHVFPCVETRMKIRPGRYLIPDVAVFHEWEPPDVPDRPPLVVVEILSPDDRISDVIEKFEEYRAWGVPHVWLVDPETRRIYSYEAGLKPVSSIRVPELELELAPAEIFPHLN